jgi:arylformamidase
MVWPGSPDVNLAPLKRLAAGDNADVSEVRLTTHTGTHVDFPSHAIPGAANSEVLHLEALVGPAWVTDLGDLEHEIDAGHLERVPAGTTRLLLKTRNSALWHNPEGPFPSSFVSLTASAATHLVDMGVRLVGIDFLSIEARSDGDRPVHVALLAAGVLILEGLDLREAQDGPCRLLCLPLHLPRSDGAPARAVLLPENALGAVLPPNA